MRVYNGTGKIPTTAELRVEFLKKKQRIMESTLLLLRMFTSSTFMHNYIHTYIHNA